MFLAFDDEINEYLNPLLEVFDSDTEILTIGTNISKTKALNFVKLVHNKKQK